VVSLGPSGGPLGCFSRVGPLGWSVDGGSVGGSIWSLLEGSRKDSQEWGPYGALLGYLGDPSGFTLGGPLGGAFDGAGGSGPL
jgi:hypothetical protein